MKRLASAVMALSIAAVLASSVTAMERPEFAQSKDSLVTGDTVRGSGR